MAKERGFGVSDFLCAVRDAFQATTSVARMLR